MLMFRLGVLLSTITIVVALSLSACASSGADDQNDGSVPSRSGTFACGDTECDQVSQYCEEVRDFDNTPVSTACKSFPDACPDLIADSCANDDALFDCLSEDPSTSWSFDCRLGGDRAFRTSVFLEPPVDRCLVDQGEVLVPDAGISSPYFTVSEIEGGAPSEYYLVVDPYALSLLQEGAEAAGADFDDAALGLAAFIDFVDIAGTGCDTDGRVAVVINVSPDNFALFLEQSTLFERLFVAFMDAVESAVETAASAIRTYFFQELFEFILGELL
jgi:hypothetical protein